MKCAMSIIALCALACPLHALAWLGGDAASVEADRQQMNATVVTASAGTHSRYELRTPSGTVVTEYLAPSGLVFAIVWKGPALPDLRQALGAYFPRYVAAATQGPGQRVVEQADFVVHAGGHLRAFLGRAYLPQSLPQGVSVEDIR